MSFESSDTGSSHSMCDVNEAITAHLSGVLGEGGLEPSSLVSLSWKLLFPGFNPVWAACVWLPPEGVLAENFVCTRFVLDHPAPGIRQLQPHSGACTHLLWVLREAWA